MASETGRVSEQERLRIAHGLQCPECFGPRISARNDRFYGFSGFLCEECGCQFSPPSRLAASTKAGAQQ